MRRMPYADNKRNEDVFREAKSQRELLNSIRRRPSTFFRRDEKGKIRIFLSTGR